MSKLTHSNNFIHRRDRRACRDLLPDGDAFFDLQKQPLRRLFHLFLSSLRGCLDFINCSVLRSGIGAISVLALVGFEQGIVNSLHARGHSRCGYLHTPLGCSHGRLLLLEWGHHNRRISVEGLGSSTLNVIVRVNRSCASLRNR